MRSFWRMHLKVSGTSISTKRTMWTYWMTTISWNIV